MAVSLEFINLVVPIRTIREKYPGGWEQCVRDHSSLIGGRVWYDEHLFRDGAMNAMDMDGTVAGWAAKGFETMQVVDGRSTWCDVCVVEVPGGSTVSCSWLEVDETKEIAWFKGAPQGDVAGRVDRGGRDDA